MKIEHIGYMVDDPIQVAAWYCQNLGFRVARELQISPFTHFLVDESGNGMLEIYNNPAAVVPDYASLDPLVCTSPLIPEMNPSRALVIA